MALFVLRQCDLFQSTLPRGSDADLRRYAASSRDFNPRSLAGATLSYWLASKAARYFNPRSLAGATPMHWFLLRWIEFQSTLPRGSDSVKMKYFYNYVNQAFIANKLNLNSKRFHFDVRKYELSHTSLSCEPKLNLWFIYLRNTKILVYKLPHHSF